MQNVKTAYICGALTELWNPNWLQRIPYAILDLVRSCLGLKPKMRMTQQWVKAFYAVLGDVCEQELGVRAFVPHEHFDPIKHKGYTPQQVDQNERRQVCEMTSVLVCVGFNPTWGGGIEVEMASHSHVPAIILQPPKSLSRLFIGNPAIKRVVQFDSVETAISGLRQALRDLELVGVGGEDELRRATSAF